jgi:Ca2+/Na+ antiporter
VFFGSRVKVIKTMVVLSIATALRLLTRLACTRVSWSKVRVIIAPLRLLRRLACADSIYNIHRHFLRILRILLLLLLLLLLLGVVERLNRFNRWPGLSFSLQMAC